MKDNHTQMPPAVRILPMSTEEFSDCSVEELQKNFFLTELPSRENGQYYHYKYGLNAPTGTIVLFQYRSKLVASAIFIEGERFDKQDEKGYEGALYFDLKSIQVFTPLGADAVRRIWPEFSGFSHVKQKLDPAYYDAFQSLIEGEQSMA